MRKSFQLWCGVFCCVFFASAAQATTRDPAMDHYGSIPERNVFALKPREQAAVAEPPGKPVRKLILTGVTTLGGYKRALLKAEPLPGSKGEKEDSLILAEGQREDDIEVVQIDEHAGHVTVNNSGSVMTLSFDKDGVKIATTPPTLPNGGPPGIPMNRPMPLPVAVPGPTVSPAQTRRWPFHAGTQPAAPSNSGTVVPAPNAATTATGAAELPADLTPEEQAIVTELRNQAAESAANPGAPQQATVPAKSKPSSPPGFRVPQTVAPAATARTTSVLPQ